MHGDDEAHPCLPDVLTYLRIEGIICGVSMYGDEGIHLLREAVHAVCLHLLQGLRLLVILAYLIVAHHVALATGEGSEDRQGEREKQTGDYLTQRNGGGKMLVINKLRKIFIFFMSR